MKVTAVYQFFMDHDTEKLNTEERVAWLFHIIITVYLILVLL